MSFTEPPIAPISSITSVIAGYHLCCLTITGQLITNYWKRICKDPHPSISITGLSPPPSSPLSPFSDRGNALVFVERLGPHLQVWLASEPSSDLKCNCHHLYEAMGNVIESFFSGFGKAVGNLFGSPLEFLSGKSCNEVCQTSWDFICYIENFCVANLLKMGLILILVYMVLLFFYLLYKLGICKCVCWTSCKMIWSCFACCILVCEYCCTFFWYRLSRVKRKNWRRRRCVREKFVNTSEDDDFSEEEERVSRPVPELELVKMKRSISRKRKHYKGARLMRSLRPKSHHARVDVSRNCSYMHNNHHHKLEVTTISKHKGRRHRARKVYRSQRW